MSQYFMLLKNGLIDFEKLIIDQYVSLGLNEIDALILIKLNRLQRDNKHFSTKDVASKMTLPENAIRDRLVGLINGQYITLTLSGKKELYSLDDTFKRLAILLEENDISSASKNFNNDFKKVVSVLEKELQKVLTPLEHEIVHNWVYQDHFSFEEINNGLLETLKYKKSSIKHIDMLLHRQNQAAKANVTSEIQELFNNVYQKIK